MKNKSILIVTFSIFFSTCLFSQSKFKKETKTEVLDKIQQKTKGCELFDGLFNIYQSKKDGKSYIEIDTSHIGKEFIYFSYRIKKFGIT